MVICGWFEMHLWLGFGLFRVCLGFVEGWLWLV